MTAGEKSDDLTNGNEDNEAPVMDPRFAETKETLPQFFRKLCNEFSYAVLWGGRTWQQIIKHFVLALVFGLVPSAYDTGTDLLLCKDYWFGNDYTFQVDRTDFREQVNNGCTLVGFYTVVNNGTEQVSSYTFTCFETHPDYAIASFVMILFPAIFAFKVLPNTVLPLHGSRALGCVVMFSAILLSLLVTFPVLLLSVKTVALFNPGERWKMLAAGLTEVEGIFESSLQFSLQLYFMFSHADRQPSVMQVLSCSASLILVTQKSIVTLLQPRDIQQQLSTREKAEKALSLFPMVVFNSLFKLFTISLVCSTLNRYALPVYLAFSCLLGFILLVRKPRWHNVCCPAEHIMQVETKNRFLCEKIIESSLSLTCLPSIYTEVQQKKQLQFHNTFWMIVNTLLLSSLLVCANLAPEMCATLGGVSREKQTSLLNIMVPVVWSCGLLSNILIHFQSSKSIYQAGA